MLNLFSTLDAIIKLFQFLLPTLKHQTNDAGFHRQKAAVAVAKGLQKNDQRTVVKTRSFGYRGVRTHQKIRKRRHYRQIRGFAQSFESRKGICGILPYSSHSTYQRIPDQVRKRCHPTQGSPGVSSRERRLRLHPENCGQRHGRISGILGHKAHDPGAYRKHAQQFHD